MLIDDIIKVDLELASIASIQQVHRKFAAFFKLTSNDEQIIVTTDNLETVLTKIDNTDIDYSTLLKMWFTSGGNELTLINTALDLSKITKIEPKNLIFIGDTVENQLVNYNTLEISIIADKNIFFSITKSTNLTNYPKSRDIFFYLDADKISFFEYFALYTKPKYYAKNNYKTSNLQGVKLDSLDFLLKNNIGALVYFPEFEESKYINIKDATGFNYNLDVLKDDLVNDIKSNLLTALSSNNSYNQNNILRLENVLATTLDTYVDLNLVVKFTTLSKPYSKQTQSDIKNNILRGLEVRYWIESEIEQTKVTIGEEV